MPCRGAIGPIRRNTSTCGYESAEFAAEYLIRNDDFVVECDRLASRLMTVGELAGSLDFAARWGARFHNLC
ncbi:transcriptional regulator domain-containing protein [Mesorhizobium australicum]|uniref:transcriptional regulator domain-containing protein n=1 Tax=Mesorhizobium australicum TaxID=536018 RepID=UPI003336C906